jgi:structural maintenance of chromosomes protein 6
VLQQKKQAIPDLKSAFREATMRFEEASKAREQKKKADELKKELAWAHVAAKEDVNLLVTPITLALSDNAIIS